MEKSLWLKNLTMAIEANTSIKPNIIGLLSAGNEEKVSHENSQGFSPLWLTAGKKKKIILFSLTTDQVLTVSLHKNILWSSHTAAGFLFPSGTFVWFSSQKAQDHNSLYCVLWHLHSYVTMASETSSCFKRMAYECDRLLFCPHATQSLSLSQWKLNGKLLFEKNLIWMQYGTGCMSNLVVTQTSPLKYIIRQASLSAPPR